MAKQVWKAGNMLNPVPVVMVTCKDNSGRDNIITIAWTGTVCSDPAMVSISVRKERFSYPMIKESGEFVINLVNNDILKACDLCGVKSGREGDKFEMAGLTRAEASRVKAPLIAESPVSMECKVKQVLELGSHDMFIAEIVAVDVDDKYLDEKGKFDMDAAGLIAYSHGEYFTLGEKVGKFGYSVKK